MSDSTAHAETQTDSTSRTRSGPRLFWVGMALLLIGVVILGFWPTYFGPLFSGEAVGNPRTPTVSWKIHMHGLVFLGWMGLLLTQTVLVARDNPQAHMRLGQYVATFGLVVVIVGAYVTYNMVSQVFDLASMSWGDLLRAIWPNLETMIQFALLLALGYVYRTSPPVHKRYMFFATVALVYAAMDRMGYLLGPWCAEIMFPVLVGPIFGYDLYTGGRVRGATLIGTAVLLPHFLFRAVL